jgi:hypothetical protein
MEPAIRSPRTESAIITATARNGIFLPPRIPDFQAAERSFALEIQLPGTEFLDAETGGQKSAAETADVYRDRRSGDDTDEIPAETASLESPTKCAVWEDWMVEMIWTKLAAPHAVIEPVSETRARNGIFCCRD